MKNFLKFFLLLFAVAGISFGASLGFTKWSDQRLSNDLQGSVLQRFNGTQEYQPAEKGSIKLTTEEASFPHVNSNQQEVRYYHSRTGQVKSVSLGTKQNVTLVATLKPRASDLTWSPDGTEVIASYGSELIYTNLADGTFAKLDPNITRPVFGKSSNSVAYLYFNKKTEEGNISVADSKFTTFKNLLKTRLSGWEIQWTNERKLSLLAITPAMRLTSLYLMDVTQEGLEVLIDSKSDVEINWSPNGQKLLYSRKAQNGIELFVLDLPTRAEKRLNIISVASKCGWAPDSATLYCAVPEKGSEDSIIKISVTGTQEKLFAPADIGYVNAHDITYLTAENSLLFKNFKDGRLYMLSLAK